MKEIITEAAFRKRIESRAAGGYIFFGDEDYLKHHALKFARQTVCPDPSLAVFNDMSVDFSATGTTPASVFSAISAAPMMADVKLVTISGLNMKDLRESELAEICEALSAIEEYDFNTLILYFPSGTIEEGTAKAPSKDIQKFGEILTPVRFDKVPDAKLGSWAVRHFNHNGVNVEAGVLSALIERCGRDMFNLVSEIDKISYFVLSEGRDVVTRADVELVSCDSAELGPFALSNAIMEGDGAGALRALEKMKARRTDPIYILGELTRMFSDMLAIKVMTAKSMPPAEISSSLRIKGERKMNEYRIGLIQQSVKDVPVERLARALDMCAKADLAMKTSMSGYLEIEKLICSAI